MWVGRHSLSNNTDWQSCLNPWIDASSPHFTATHATTAISNIFLPSSGLTTCATHFVPVGAFERVDRSRL
jgi:hypothetical protein